MSVASTNATAASGLRGAITSTDQHLGRRKSTAVWAEIDLSS